MGVRPGTYLGAFNKSYSFHIDMIKCKMCFFLTVTQCLYSAKSSRLSSKILRTSGKQCLLWRIRNINEQVRVQSDRDGETELLPQHLTSRVLAFNLCSDSKFLKLLDYQVQIFSLFLFLPANIPRAVVFLHETCSALAAVISFQFIYHSLLGMQSDKKPFLSWSIL